MEVEISSRFRKSFRRLHVRVQKKAVERTEIFKESGGRDPRLAIHKLHGKKRDEWTYSVDHSYRISYISTSKEQNENLFSFCPSEVETKVECLYFSKRQ